MTTIETLYSLPGDWIGGDGKPRGRRPVRRILVLKADHIGDLLIVDPAFALLRQCFPEAAIELICGPWNVALAHRFGRFDVVHGVRLFEEVSARQNDSVAARAARQAGAQALRDLRLGAFDLAIDLRYDTDTRPLLRSIEAKVYAGFGSTHEFPFLDIVLPRHEIQPTHGPERACLAAESFVPRAASGVGTLRGSGDLSAHHAIATVILDITGAATPRSCRTGNDDRKLGIGLETLHVTPLAEDGSPLADPLDTTPFYGPGWASPEAWGCWTIADRAELSFAIPPLTNMHAFCIEVLLRAHVNPVNRHVTCTIRCAESSATTTVEFEHPTHVAVVTQRLSATLAHRSLVSGPFNLVPGRYAGLVRLLATRPLRGCPHIEVSLHAPDGSAELLRQAIRLPQGARGLINLPFQALVDTCGKNLLFEIETAETALFDGVRIHHVDLSLVERLRTSTPVSHMQDWASLLVLRTAQILSDIAPFARPAPAHRGALAQPPPEGPVPDRLAGIEQAIARWKARGEAVVGIGLGCNSPIRRWPVAYFIDLVDRISHIRGTRVLFIGAAAEADEAAEVCKLLGWDPAVHSVCGATPLDWLGVLVNRLDMFIGNNTGTTHYASKVGIRTIGIYAGTNHPREWGPTGEEASWIYRNEPCAPCHLTELNDCTQGHRCMIDLLPEAVFSIVRPELEAILSIRSRSCPVTLPPRRMKVETAVSTERISDMTSRRNRSTKEERVSY